MIQDTPSAVRRPATALTGAPQVLAHRFPANQPDISSNPDHCAIRFCAWGAVGRPAAPAAEREQRRVLETPVSGPGITGSRQ